MHVFVTEPSYALSLVYIVLTLEKRIATIQI